MGDEVKTEHDDKKELINNIALGMTLVCMLIDYAEHGCLYGKLYYMPLRDELKSTIAGIVE